MEQEVAAYILRIAPRETQAEWRQQSLKRLLSRWESEQPDGYELATTEKMFGGAVGYHISGTEDGRYGHRAGYTFELNLDPQLLDGSDRQETLCREFTNEWIEELQSVIEDQQESTFFTPKEMAVLYAHRNPSVTETKAADALGITVGTYRGKIGRVKDKLSKAHATLETEGVAQTDSDGDWDDEKYPAPLTVIDRVDEDRLPVQAYTNYPVDGTQLHEAPLEQLIRD